MSAQYEIIWVASFKWPNTSGVIFHHQQPNLMGILHKAFLSSLVLLNPLRKNQYCQIKRDLCQGFKMHGIGNIITVSTAIKWNLSLFFLWSVLLLLLIDKQNTTKQNLAHLIHCGPFLHFLCQQNFPLLPYAQ